MTGESRNWHELCEAASKEPDSERLMVLVSELIEALDERKIPANPVKGEGPPGINGPITASVFYPHERRLEERDKGI